MPNLICLISLLCLQKGQVNAEVSPPRDTLFLAVSSAVCSTHRLLLRFYVAKEHKNKYI